MDKEKHTLEKRMAELSGKVRKLFDDHANGVIDDGNYEMLMRDIQAQQTESEQKLSVLRSRLNDNQNAEMQIEQFKKSVCECLNVQELTPFILNKLIAKIEIGSVEVVDGEKEQEVIIKWRFSENII